MKDSDSGRSVTVNREPDGIRQGSKAAGEAEPVSPDSRKSAQKTESRSLEDIIQDLEKEREDLLILIEVKNRQIQDLKNAIKER